jgi:hypothetical protein
MTHREEAERLLKYVDPSKGVQIALVHAVLSLQEKPDDELSDLVLPLAVKVAYYVGERGTGKFWNEMARQCRFQATEAQKREMRH